MDFQYEDNRQYLDPLTNLQTMVDHASAGQARNTHPNCGDSKNRLGWKSGPVFLLPEQTVSLRHLSNLNDPPVPTSSGAEDDRYVCPTRAVKNEWETTHGISNAFCSGLRTMGKTSLITSASEKDVSSGHDKLSPTPHFAATMNSVDLDRSLECRSPLGVLDHTTQLERDQPNSHFSVQRRGDFTLGPLLQRKTQDPDVRKHFTLFPKAADLLRQSHKEQGDQYSCLTHEMVDLTDEAYESPQDGLFLCSGRAAATMSTGSTRVNLHPVNLVNERGGASSISNQHRKTSADGHARREITDELALTLCTSARHSHSSELGRVA